MIMALKDKNVIKVHCQDCGKLILKRKHQSWRFYAKRKFCDRACLARNMSKIQMDAKAVLKLPDGTIMPLGNYIKKNTNDLKDTVDFYIGLVKRINNAEDDAVDVSRYKGIEIDTDLLKTANRFLVENSDGKPGQRQVMPEIDNRNEDEKLREMEYILKELGYRMVKIENT